MQVDRKTFAAALRRVAPAVGSRGQIASYTGVRIVGYADVFHLYATNGDMAIDAQDAAKSEGSLDVVVPHAVLSRFVSAAAGDVTLSLADDNLEVASAGAKIRLRTLPPDDFPPFPTINGDGAAADYDTIQAMRAVSYAASRDHARPVLACVRLEPGWVVATDSYRLAAHKVQNTEGECLVPASALSAARDGARWDMMADDMRVALSDGATTVVVRQVAGQYPTWQRLVPDTTACTVEVDREQLLDALKRAAVLQAEDQPVKMLPGDGGIRLELSARDVGDYSENLDAKAPADFPMIAFRPAFLAETLEGFTGATATIGFDGPHKPIKLAEGDMVALVMPVRVS